MKTVSTVVMWGGGGGGGGTVVKNKIKKREGQTNRINHIILIVKMCVSMYKKTNAFLPLSMRFQKSAQTTKCLIMTKLKNENCVHCDIVQDVHVHCDQGEEAECRMYMYTVTKGKRQSAGCTCTL